MRVALQEPQAGPPRASTFLASPLGWWSVHALGEGLVTVCTLGVLWGAWYAGVTIVVWGLLVAGVEIWVRHRDPRRAAA